MSDTCCRGVVRGSAVVLEESAHLPEGTDVLVAPVGRSRGASHDIIEVLNASPPVTHEDVEELLRLIREGRRPARYGSPFVRNKKKRTR